MGGRGSFVSIALAFALVLVNVSICTCVTITYSNESNALTQWEREKVYSVLQQMVNNDNKIVDVSRSYHAGRLFTSYIELDHEKGVVVRLTRWSSECSVSMSPSDTTKGRDLLEAWHTLLPQMKYFLLDRGYEWVGASSHTDWIDYFVTHESPPLGTPPLNADAASFKTVSVGNRETDCTIQPSMLLSHHSALPFSQLRPGDSLLSPDGKYKLTIPDYFGAPCELDLVDTKTGHTKWRSASSFPQGDCRAAFRTYGTLELWKSSDQVPIWNSASACPIYDRDCAGAASLAFNDGDIKLYRSVDDRLNRPYWST